LVAGACAAMTVTLPYEFDTSGIVKVILRGVLGLLFVVVVPGVQGRAHERVCLVGKDGTPDILIARTALDTGRPLGDGIAKVLNLPYEERLAPY
jgi:hypothetical protein